MGLQCLKLFRSSRPDYIETAFNLAASYNTFNYCSGLPDRTTLRLQLTLLRSTGVVALFRSSRPDYIETTGLHR